MVELIKFNVNNIDLTDFSLIIPSVSVGNVGQLTIDLLISSYNLKKVASIWHPGIIPLVGGDPFESESTDVCTACELYINESLKIAAIQLRSSIEYKLALNFFNKLKEEIVKLKFLRVIILTSTFAYELHNIESSHFRYICEEKLDDLQIPAMEFEESGRFIQGSGFAVQLYDILKDSICVMVFLKYTSEGDNRLDALSMLNLIFKYLKPIQDKDTNEVKFPSSWEYVYGNPPPVGIF